MEESLQLWRDLAIDCGEVFIINNCRNSNILVDISLEICRYTVRIP